MKARKLLAVSLGAGAALLGTVTLGAPAASQASFRVIAYLHQLGPVFGLTEASPGLFLSVGGYVYQGAISITPQGTIADLGRFPNHYQMYAYIIGGGNDRFYASVSASLSETFVFSLTPAPGSKQVYMPQQYSTSFTTSMPSGKLLGIGWGPSDLPFVVESDTSGVVTPIHSFANGTRLQANTIYATDGNIYGLYYLHDGSGSVYRLAPDGAFAKVITFPVNAFTNASVPLLQSIDGNLYGTTTSGGANGTGTIYRLTLTGQHTTLYEFPAGAVANPTELIEASDGNLYGATLGTDSVLFRVTKSGQYTQLHAMNGYTDGQCQCYLTQGSDGVIYGTTSLGGPPGVGDVFALDAGLPKPAPWPRAFEPQSGAAGTRVRIWGTNLLAATVQFNGVAATGVSNSGSSYVWATVPAGATTGPIAVTTPGGTSATQAVFMVQ